MASTYRVVGISSTVASLAAAFQRRRERIALRGVVPEDQVPTYLDVYLPGCAFGRYREPIVKREVRRFGIPAWFDPKEHNSGQFGIVGRNGVRVYLQVEIDHAARNAPSTFDEQIRALAIPTPVQESLLP